MATFYLHIGTMKTGTTAIQQFLALNRDVLETKGYSYPVPDKRLPSNYKFRNGHFLIYHSNLEEIENKKEEEEKFWRSGFDILKEAAEKHEHIILSDEVIWNRSRKRADFWDRFKEEMEALDSDFKVIVYLRRQDLFIESYWNQSVKSEPRIDMSFEKFIQRKKAYEYRITYYEQLLEIADQIGKENIIVRVYEKNQFEGTNNTLIADFLHYVGLELTDEYKRADIQVNDKISDNFIEIKRILNELSEARPLPNFMKKPIQRAYANYVRVQGGEKAISMFSPEEREKFLDRYKEGNEKIAREFLGREDGILFRDEIKKLPKWEFNEKEIYRDIIYVLGEANAEQQQMIDLLLTRTKQMEKDIKKLKAEINSIKNNPAISLYRKAKNAFHKS